MALLGAADIVSVSIRITLVQISTPDEMRGRVGAVSSICTGASNEIGEFRAGPMAALIGTVPAVLDVGMLFQQSSEWIGSTNPMQNSEQPTRKVDSVR